MTELERQSLDTYVGDLLARRRFAERLIEARGLTPADEKPMDRSESVLFYGQMMVELIDSSDDHTIVECIDADDALIERIRVAGEHPVEELQERLDDAWVDGGDY